MGYFSKKKAKDIHLRLTDEEYSWYQELKKSGILVTNLLRIQLKELYFKHAKDKEKPF